MKGTLRVPGSYRVQRQGGKERTLPIKAAGRLEQQKVILLRCIVVAVEEHRGLGEEGGKGIVDASSGERARCEGSTAVITG